MIIDILRDSHETLATIAFVVTWTKSVQKKQRAGRLDSAEIRRRGRGILNLFLNNLAE